MARALSKSARHVVPLRERVSGNKVAPNRKANVVTGQACPHSSIKVHTLSGRALKGATIEADVGWRQEKVTSDGRRGLPDSH